MADYVTLLGAEDVRAAGNAMRAAADDMRSAASSIDTSFDRHQRFLDDWLQRFDAAIERLVRSNDDADLPEPMLCLDCGVDTGLATSQQSEYYMVHDETWASAKLGSDDGYLCVGCLDKRIGRELTAADFKDVPINARHFQRFGTPRIRNRLGYDG